MKKILWNIYKIFSILLAGYVAILLSSFTIEHLNSDGVILGLFVGFFLFALFYGVFVWMPHKVYAAVFPKKHSGDKPIWVFFKEHVSGDTVSNSDDFDTVEEAVDFMKSSLHIEMTNIKKYRNVSSAKEAIEYWKQYGMDYYIFQNSEAFSSLAYVTKQAEEIWGSSLEKEEPIKKKSNPHKGEKMPKLENFQDLLKRGTLPDDDRVVPNWLKIKNEQFSNVDFSRNKANIITSLSSAEFNEFVSGLGERVNMLLAYLSTLSPKELKKFYTYLDSVETKDGFTSAKEQFMASMKKVEAAGVSDMQKAVATLEMPIEISSAKYLYGKITHFMEYLTQDYYNHEVDDAFKMYEGHLSKIIWDRMDNIPDHFEQVIDHFQNFYDDENEAHQKFFAHLAKRFGLLIATLNRLVYETQGRVTSLDWFTSIMSEKELVGDVSISVSASKAMSTDKKLINFHTLTFGAICNEDDDNYLMNLISVVECMFEWYPVNREACEYVMVEMMKSVAIKKVNSKNANSFIAFFEALPRFYEVLSFEIIIGLKELINITLVNEKPLDNIIFDQEGVKHKLILHQYLVDMEDLYYESQVR